MMIIVSDGPGMIIVSDGPAVTRRVGPGCGPGGPARRVLRDSLSQAQSRSLSARPVGLLHRDRDGASCHSVTVTVGIGARGVTAGPAWHGRVTLPRTRCGECAARLGHMLAPGPGHGPTVAAAPLPGLAASGPA